MASFEKYTDGSVIGQIGHDTRCRTHDNPDIDDGRSRDNICITPYIHIPQEEQYDRREEIKNAEIEYYRKTLNDYYIYNPKKQYTAVGTVITLPLDTPPEDAERFYKAVMAFNEERMGPTIAAHIHLDENGNGRSHCHIINFATVKIDHKAIQEKIAKTEARGGKSRVPLALREKREDGTYKYDRKIACDELMGGVKGRLSQKQEEGFYETYHRDLQEYLKERGVPGTVVSKDPSGSRINLSVSQLKEYTARTGKTISPAILREMTVDRIISVMEREHARERDAWGREKEDRTWSR